MANGCGCGCGGSQDGSQDKTTEKELFESKEPTGPAVQLQDPSGSQGQVELAGFNWWLILLFLGAVFTIATWDNNEK